MLSGSSFVAAPVIVMPALPSGKPKRALSAATIRSESIAISKPPPTASPRTDAITTLRAMRMMRGMACRPSVMSSTMSRMGCISPVWSSGYSLRAFFRSSPAQNESPTLEMTIALTSGSSAASCSARTNAPSSSESSAFRISGRLNRVQAIPSLISYSSFAIYMLS